MGLDARIPAHGQGAYRSIAFQTSDQERTAVELDNDGHLSCKTTFGCKNLPPASSVVEYVLDGRSPACRYISRWG
jgi:hypothetical protein